MSTPPPEADIKCAITPRTPTKATYIVKTPQNRGSRGVGIKEESIEPELPPTPTSPSSIDIARSKSIKQESPHPTNATTLTRSSPTQRFKIRYGRKSIDIKPFAAKPSIQRTISQIQQILMRGGTIVTTLEQYGDHTFRRIVCQLTKSLNEFGEWKGCFEEHVATPLPLLSSDSFPSPNCDADKKALHMAIRRSAILKIGTFFADMATTCAIAKRHVTMSTFPYRRDVFELRMAYRSCQTSMDVILLRGRAENLLSRMRQDQDFAVSAVASLVEKSKELAAEFEDIVRESEGSEDILTACSLRAQRELGVKYAPMFARACVELRNSLA